MVVGVEGLLQETHEEYPVWGQNSGEKGESKGGASVQVQLTCTIRDTND